MSLKEQSIPFVSDDIGSQKYWDIYELTWLLLRVVSRRYIRTLVVPRAKKWANLWECCSTYWSSNLFRWIGQGIGTPHWVSISPCHCIHLDTPSRMNSIPGWHSRSCLKSIWEGEARSQLVTFGPRLHYHSGRQRTNRLELNSFQWRPRHPRTRPLSRWIFWQLSSVLHFPSPRAPNHRWSHWADGLVGHKRQRWLFQPAARQTLHRCGPQRSDSFDRTHWIWGRWDENARRTWARSWKCTIVRARDREQWQVLWLGNVLVEARFWDLQHERTELIISRHVRKGLPRC